MEIIVRGRSITVPSRFRQHAAAKLAKLAKLDHKAVRIDVEVSKERNPRQSDRRERVELTIRSRGPAIRAEAAADDRLHGTRPGRRQTRVPATPRLRSPQGPARRNATLRSPALIAAEAVAPEPALNGNGAARPHPAELDDQGDGAEPDSGMVPIQMEGDGPLVLREKVHAARPMTIDQALLEMELVGHDFYLFHDSECDRQRRLPPPRLRLRGHPTGRGVARGAAVVSPWMRAGPASQRPGLHHGRTSVRV